MSRKATIRQYLRDLVSQYEILTAERAALLNPQERLAQLNAERAEILADAQEALTKFNAVNGTSYTLADVRKMFSPPAPPNPGPVINP